MKENKKKVIIILGPTAAGKTNFALKLAKKLNTFVISADSRQIYKDMNIGTDKPKGNKKSVGTAHCAVRSLDRAMPYPYNSIYYVNNIPHYLMDIVKPDKNYTLANWQKQANDLIKNSDTIPLIVGGTGLYISSIVNNYQLPEGKVNIKLRKKLENRDLNKLSKQLKELDPKTHELIDKKNKRRITRALEYILSNHESYYEKIKSEESPFEFLQIGIGLDKKKLHKNIEKRVDEMIYEGLIDETEKLLKTYPPTLPSMSGIGYKECYFYLNGFLDLEDLKYLIKKNTKHYAKRQMTWFKRDKNINWVDDVEEAQELVNNFL